MRTLLLILIFSATLLKSQNNKELSVSLINKLQTADYESCQVMFDTSVSSKLNPDMLKSIWESLSKYFGEYQSYSEINSEKTDSVETVTVRCVFVKTKMDLKLSFNQKQKIIGIFFVPPKNNLAYNYPSYYKSSKFYESKINLKSGKYELPAVLSIPNNISNPPVVILLAGSGPNDKDETIGPNKILKDIAVGLATNGIASIRYDKRSLTYGAEMAKDEKGFTIEDEVIDDAVNAVSMIRKNPLFKKSKIFIIGHSLGAMCAPLIATETKVNGIILLAGNARPMDDLLIEQFTYIYGLDSLDADERENIEDLKSQIKTLNDPTLLKTASADKLPLGLPSAYWQSIKKYDQLATAKKLKSPILILQGERDYQVTMTDFNLWKQNLNSNPKNTFISYPALNHLFIAGDGKSTPEEYEKQRNVEEKVIVDITEWVKAH